MRTQAPPWGRARRAQGHLASDFRKARGISPPPGPGVCLVCVHDRQQISG